MPGVVEGLNMTNVSMCESTTGWTAVGGTNSVSDPTVSDAREGAFHLQNYSASAAARGSDFTYGSNQDLTGKLVLLWFGTTRVTGIPNKGPNGMRIRIEDVSANWAEWDIFGGDTLPHGGWIPWAVLASSATWTRTSVTPPVLTAIRKIGWRCGTAGTTVGSKTYIYWDAVRYGEGLKIYGGTSGSATATSFSDLVASELTGAWGIYNRYKGVDYVQGKIQIGLATGSATYFKDTNKSIVFMDTLLGPSFNSIKIQGAHTGAFTQVYLGEKFGSQGIKGCNFFLEAVTATGSQTAKYAVEFSGSSRSIMGIYGCSFRNAAVGVCLPPASGTFTREVYNTTFDTCGEILADSAPIYNSLFTQCGQIEGATANMDACTITGGTGSYAMHIRPQASLVDCSFLGNNYGLRIDLTGTYAFDGTQFASNAVKDVYVSAVAGTVTIDCTNGADSPTYDTAGATVTINNPVTHTLNGIVYASEVTYVRRSDDEVLFHVESVTGVGLETAYQYNYLADVDVSILVFHLDYVPYALDVTLSNANQTVPIQQTPDPNYYNP